MGNIFKFWPLLRWPPDPIHTEPTQKPPDPGGFFCQASRAG
jgi:hypothetical protein